MIRDPFLQVKSCVPFNPDMYSFRKEDALSGTGTVRKPLSLFGMDFISEAFPSKISAFVIETVDLFFSKEKSDMDRLGLLRAVIRNSI